MALASRTHTTTALVRREIGARLVMVPDAATMVFPGGGPRCIETDGILASLHGMHWSPSVL